MSNQLSELLANLHLALSKELLKRIEDGQATAADLSVAAKFLKDHGITVNPDVKNTPLSGLHEALAGGGPLPFPIEEASG